MKILSWNVNGVRAILKKDFLGFLKDEKPDIIGLQEVKISEVARVKEKMEFEGYTELWNSAERPGYSGTLTLVRRDVVGFTNGVGVEEFDGEGRVQTVELEDFYFVNVYFPNANRELSRLDYKIRFDEELLKYVKSLDKKKPVIITGDFNVAHEEIDLARPAENVGRPGFTDEERAWMTKFIKNGFVDSFRELNGEKVQYTWWSYRTAARKRNVGWRLDYFCVSERFMKRIRRSYIMDKVMGSDHCPVGIEIKK